MGCVCGTGPGVELNEHILEVIEYFVRAYQNSEAKAESKAIKLRERRERSRAMQVPAGAFWSDAKHAIVVSKQLPREHNITGKRKMMTQTAYVSRKRLRDQKDTELNKAVSKVETFLETPTKPVHKGKISDFFMMSSPSAATYSASPSGSALTLERLRDTLGGNDADVGEGEHEGADSSTEARDAVASSDGSQCLSVADGKCSRGFTLV